jgi:hypothetical protein
MELRPLGFGEIFDRAVTLYIRNIVPFVAIVMVLVLPLSLIQYVIDRISQPEFDVWWRLIRHPAEAQSAQMPNFFTSPLYDLSLVATVLIAFVAWPFALNAVAVGVARLYGGRPVEFRACYAAVLHRWPQIFGMLGLELLVFLGWYFVTVAIAVIAILVAAALSAASSALAAVFGVLAVVVVFLVMMPLLAPLVVSLAFGMYAIVIEERGTVEAFVLGFARVFNRAEFWRAVLFAFATMAVLFGASMMFAGVAFFAAVVHLPGLQALIQAIPNAIISPFGVVLLSIYYFDVRIRREGFDLEAALDRLTVPQPA